MVRPPWFSLPSPVRRDSAPDCEAGTPPDVQGGHVVGLVKAGNGRRTPGPCGRDEPGGGKEEPMSDLQAIADRVQIEALRGEAADAGITASPDNSSRAVMDEEVT